MPAYVSVSPSAASQSAPSAARAHRFVFLDVLRGTAVLWMALYHAVFDLHYFGLASVSLGQGFWLYFQRTIATLFILVFGVSLSLSFSRRSRENPATVFPVFFSRFLFLGGIAVLITLATFLYPNRGFIVFGILHFLALSTLLAYPFLRFRSLNVFPGLLAVAIGFLLIGVTVDHPFLLWLGLPPKNFYTLDYFPLFPWFGIVLLGVALGDHFFPDGKPRYPIPIAANPFSNGLAWLGRRALPIYLIHQPILVGLILLSKALAP